MRYSRPAAQLVAVGRRGRGLVEREPDPDDGRSVRVLLTDAGRTRVDDALTDLLAHERRILAALAPDDREKLADLLRLLAIPFET